MVQIGELAYKTRFDGRELTKGLMSTRQQMAAAKKLAEDTRTPLDKYRTGLDNLAAMSQRYSHVAARQAELSKQLEKQYLQEESAVRKLTKAERSRLELLQLPDQIKARAAATPSPAAARDAANRKRGQDFVQRRDAMFSGIDRQQADGRAALRERLAAFRQSKEDRRNNIGSSRAFNNMPLSGTSGVGANFHTAGQKGDAPERQGGIGSGFAFGAKAMAGGFAVAKLAEGVSAMRDFAAESSRVYVSLEKTQAAFDVFTGSSTKTQAIIASMKQLSALSGVTFSTMSEGAATMMSYGMSTEDTTTKLKQLATISRGDSERFKMMALAFGQVTAAGRLMGQETLQLINAGFNPLAEISRTTGRSMADLKKDMENGLITVEMVSNAFASATGEGGRYNGMLEKIGQTTAGMQAKSSAAWEQAKADVGEALAPLTQWQSWISGEFAKSISDMANGLKSIPKLPPAPPQVSAEEMKNREVADPAQRAALSAAKANDQTTGNTLADSIKKEQERQKAMRESGLASIPEMSLAVQTDTIKDEDMKKFQRATSLMDEVTKKQATIDFAENGDLAMVYSYLDKEVQKELEKVDALEQQNKLLAEQKEQTKRMGDAGQQLYEKNQTAAERYKKQLDDIAKLQDVGAIDATTALRERMAIQKQMQSDLGQNVPQDLLAGSATAARSINAGSAEAAKYMDDLRALVDGSKTKSNDPHVKALEELNKKNDTAIAETRRQTRVLEKIADTSPKRAR